MRWVFVWTTVEVETRSRRRRSKEEAEATIDLNKWLASDVFDEGKKGHLYNPVGTAVDDSPYPSSLSPTEIIGK